MLRAALHTSPRAQAVKSTIHMLYLTVGTPFHMFPCKVHNSHQQLFREKVQALDEAARTVKILNRSHVCQVSLHVCNLLAADSLGEGRSAAVTHEPQLSLSRKNLFASVTTRVVRAPSPYLCLAYLTAAHPSEACSSSQRMQRCSCHVA